MSNNTQSATAQLNMSTIASWDNSDYAQLTGEIISAMSNEQISELSHPEWITTTAIASLSAAQMPALSTTLASVSAAWVNSLSIDALEAMSIAQLNQLSPATLAGLDDDHLALLMPEQVAGMTHLDGLSAAQFGDLDLSALTASAIGSWTQAEYAGLTAQQVAFMTADQLHALQHPEWMPDSAVSGLTHSQLSQLNVDVSALPASWLDNLDPDIRATLPPAKALDFATATAADLNALSKTALQAATVSQLNQISAQTLAALDDAQLSALTAEQVAGMSHLGDLSGHQYGLLNISGLTTSAIHGWGKTTLVAVTAGQIAQLSAAQVDSIPHIDWLSADAYGGLQPSQMSGFTIDLYWVSADQLNAMSPATFATLTDAQLNQINTDKLAQLSSDHLSALTAAQVAVMTNLGKLTAAQVSVLDISAMTSDALAHLSQEQCQGLTATQLRSLSDDKLAAFKHSGWIPEDARAALDNRPIDNFGSVSALRLSAMTLDEFRALSAAQLNQVKADTLAQLDDAHLSALTDKQVAALTNLGSLSSEQFGLLDISAQETSTIADWSWRQFCGLTAHQLSLLDDKQLNAIYKTNWINDPAFAGIGALQVNALIHWLPFVTIKQFNFLPLASLQAITPDSMAHMSADTLQGLDDAHLAAITAAQIGAMNCFEKLSSHQFSLLDISAMPASIISQWTQTEYQGLSAAQVAGLDFSQVKAMQHLDWAPAGLRDALNTILTPDLSTVSADWLNNLTSADLAALTPAQLNQLSVSALQGLDHAHLASLTLTQLAGMTQLQALSAEQVTALSALDKLDAATFSQLNIRNFTASTIHSWGQDIYGKISAAQIATFSPEQIAAIGHQDWLSVAAYGGLQPSQMAAFAISTGWLSADQLNAMSTDAFALLTNQQLGQIDGKKLAALHDDHLLALSKEQIAVLSDLSVLNDTLFGKLDISALPSTAISSWGTAMYGKVTAAQVASLSTEQIDSMNHPDWLSVEGYRGLKASQMSAFTINLNWVTADRLNAMPVDAFAKLTNSQLSEISVEKVAALDNDHLSALSATQVAALSHPQGLSGAQLSVMDISGLSDSTLAGLSQAQCQGLTATQLLSLSDAQLAAFAHPDWFTASALDALGAHAIADFSTVSALRLSLLTSSQLQALSIDQLNDIKAETLAKLDASLLAELTEKQVAGMIHLDKLSAAQFGRLNLASVTTDQIKEWSWSDLQRISAQQVAKFSNDQLAAITSPGSLTDAAYAGLGATQVNILVPWTYFLYATQWHAMPLETLQAILPAHMAMLKPDMLATFDDAHLSALTVAQIAAMDCFGNLSSHQFSLLNISAMPASTIGKWTQTEYSGLTTAQIASLNPDQARAIQHTEWLSAAQQNALNAALSPDYSSKNADWLNGLTTATFAGLTASQLNQLSPSVLQGLDDAHIAALTGQQMAGMTHLGALTAEQILHISHPEALSAAQFAQLNVTGFTVEQLNGPAAALLPDFSSEQLNSLGEKTLAALSDALLSGLSASQVAGMTTLGGLSAAQFGLLDLSAMSAGAITAWTAAEYAGLTARQVVGFSATQVAALQHPEWLSDAVRSSLVVAQLPDLATATAGWLNQLSLSALQALSAEQLNKISPATLAGLDDGHLSALTDKQVAAMSNLGSLSAAQFGLLNLSGLSTSAIKGWGSAQYSAITARQIAAMSADQINAMDHIDWVSADVAQGLTAEQAPHINVDLSWMNANWINHLSLDAFKSLTAAQVDKITAATLAGLDNDHIRALTAGQTVGMVSNVADLSAAWLNTLTPQAFAALNIGKVAASALQGLDQAHLAAMTLAQGQTLTVDLSALGAEWFNQLTLTTFTGISYAELGTLSDAVIHGLDSAHQAALSEKRSYLTLTAAELTAMSDADFRSLKHDEWIQVAAAHGLTAGQIRQMNLNFAVYTSEWLNSLSLDAFNALSITQLNQINPVALRELDAAHLASLSAEQVAGMTGLASLSSDQFSNLAISAITPGDVANWTRTEYSGLTAAQVASMTPAQIKATSHPDWIPGSAASGLTREQINPLSSRYSIFNAAWLNQVKTDVLPALVNWRLNGITPEALAGLDDAHLACLTADQVKGMTQLSALSSTQIGLLNTQNVDAAWLNRLSTSEIVFLSDAQIAALSPDARKGMDADHQAALAARVSISGFSAEQIAQFSGSFAPFSADMLNHLSIDAFKAITVAQIKDIAVSTLRDLDADHLNALSATQVAAIDADFSALTADWLNGLSTSAFAGISAKQFTQIHPQTLAHLDAKHVQALTDALASFSDDALLVFSPQLTTKQKETLSLAQQTMLASSLCAGESLLPTLQDASFKAAVQSVFDSGASLFSFSSIESVLKGFASQLTGAITADQYADLNRYLQDVGNVCGINAPVYGLLNGMITGVNNASVDWANSGAERRIGSLQVGSTPQVFNQLLGSWLEGANNPDDSLDRVSGVPLFGSKGPVITDISQGGIGDCTFLSTLQAVVNVSPDYIKNMVVENSNGTYSVRFFHNFNASWVTVDNHVSGPGAYAKDAAWPAIFERAYLTFRETYCDEKNNYGTIDGAWANLMTDVTGDTITMMNASDDKWLTDDFEALKKAVLAGQPADISSWETTHNATTGKTELVSAHMLAITGFDIDTNKFIISNPWSSRGNDNFSGTFENSMEQLREDGKSAIAILNSAGAAGVVGQLITAMAAAPVAAGGATAPIAPPSVPHADLAVPRF